MPLKSQAPGLQLKDLVLCSQSLQSNGERPCRVAGVPGFASLWVHEDNATNITLDSDAPRLHMFASQEVQPFPRIPHSRHFQQSPGGFITVRNSLPFSSHFLAGE